MLMLSPAGSAALLERYAVASERGGAFHEASDLRQAALTDMIQELVESGQGVRAVSIYKGWSEVDTFADYRRAWASEPKRKP